MKKYKNIFLVPYSTCFQQQKIKSNPIRILIAPISVCNYRCLFCEIYKDNLLYPNRSKNVVDLNVIKNYESFLSSSYKLSFSGGTEEPLLNKDFGKIVQYLKQEYGTKMMVNTNASMLNRDLADNLIKFGFDLILVSYHAGSKEKYKELMTGNIDIVDENLRYLKIQKKQNGKNKPVVNFNFALHKLNAAEYVSIFEKAKSLGVSQVIINKYYGGRNRLQDKKVSFDYDIKEGNQVLDKIYVCAEKGGIQLRPPMPQYWTKEKVKWNPEYFDASIKCTLPWTDLNFKPVVGEKNCHYVSVCNRINLFKIAYDKIQLKTQKQLDVLWNHPALQYLRKTVNSKEMINPMCKYCKNYDTATIRNIDAQKYAEIRDKAIRDFFAEFREQYSFEEIDGLEVLTENPDPDEKFKKKLKELEN
ncbi:MAG: radical SAM protein [Desulfobacteraceae bacterium]|nr:radical SAM protein [Desulfobacteraceae bacterium]